MKTLIQFITEAKGRYRITQDFFYYDDKKIGGDMGYEFLDAGESRTNNLDELIDTLKDFEKDVYEYSDDNVKLEYRDEDMGFAIISAFDEKTKEYKYTLVCCTEKEAKKYNLDDLLKKEHDHGIDLYFSK